MMPVAKKKPAAKPAKAAKKPQETRRIHRSKLINAPYNPRTIDPVSAKRLRESLQTYGMIQNPIWNETTGHIVGGHQRLQQWDSLQGTKDYELDVTVVRWPLEKEINANIALNSPLLAGQYDVEKMDSLLLQDGVDLGAAGLDLSLLESLHIEQGVELPDWMLGDDDLDADEALDEEGITDDLLDTFDEVDAAEDDEATRDEIERLKERKQDFKRRKEFEQQTELSFRVVCPSEGTCRLLLKKLGVPTGATGDFVDGERLAILLDCEQEFRAMLKRERPEKRKLAAPPKPGQNPKRKPPRR